MEERERRTNADTAKGSQEAEDVRRPRSARAQRGGEANTQKRRRGAWHMEREGKSNGESHPPRT